MLTKNINNVSRISFIAHPRHNFSTIINKGKHTSVRIGCDYRTFFGFLVIVPENYALLLHRLKKFNRQLKPGLNFKIPIIDTIEYVHDLREQVVEIQT